MNYQAEIPLPDNGGVMLIGGELPRQYAFAVAEGWLDDAIYIEIRNVDNHTTVARILRN